MIRVMRNARRALSYRSRFICIPFPPNQSRLRMAATFGGGSGYRASGLGFWWQRLATLGQEQMIAGKHGLLALIENFQALNDETHIRSFVGPLFGDGDLAANGVADEDGFDEAEPIVPVGKGEGVDVPRSHADGDAEDKRAVGDALTEILGFAPLGVHVMGIEVAGLPGVEDDVGLGDGAAQGLPFFALGVILEMSLPNLHGVPRAPRTSWPDQNDGIRCYSRMVGSCVWRVVASH